MTVAALYVDPAGVYAGLDDVEVWDEARDARQYNGPKSMTPEECHMDERGDKWDVCDECAFQEASLADSYWCKRRTDA